MIMSSGSPVAAVGQADDESTSDEKEKKEKRLRDIRAQIEQIKRQIEETDGPQPGTLESRRTRDSDNHGDNAGPHGDTVLSPKRNTDLDDRSNSLRGAGGAGRPNEAKRRQRETIERVNRFKNKLKEVSKAKDTSNAIPSTSFSPNNNGPDDETSSSGDLDLVDGDSWLRHRFEAKDEPNSDFEDHEEETQSRRQPNEGGQPDPAGVPRKRHKLDRNRSPDKSYRESRELPRERHSSPSRHHHHHSRHRHHEDKDHRRHGSSDDRDRHRNRPRHQH